MAMTRRPNTVPRVATSAVAALMSRRRAALAGGAARAAALSTGHIRLLKQAPAAGSTLRMAYHIRCLLTGFSVTGTQADPAAAERDT